MNRRNPLTEAEKDHIYSQKMKGRTLIQIAQELDCSYEATRKWWRHRRDKRSPRARGRPAQGALSTYSEQIRETAVQLKRRYPHRGSKMIRLDLQARLSLQEDELPSASRLAVLFKEVCPEAVQAYQRRQYAATKPPAATNPHEVWQVDGKEKVQFAQGEIATVLNVRDPYSGLMILSQATCTTTEKGWRKLTRAEVQNSLRQAFHQWGRPLVVQTDREVVYIGAPERYFPSLFTLWLTGLGVKHQVLRPRRPTDQGAVEREHRTLGNWLWADTVFKTITHLQNGLDEMNQRYNHSYPAKAKQCQGQPPLSAFPHATHSGRSFHPALEWELFDLKRVDQYLATQVWTRTVSDTGTVSVSAQPYYLGAKYAGQKVSVSFLPATRAFCFQTQDGELIDELSAQGLGQEDIIGLTPLDTHWPTFQTQPFQLPLPLEGV
jgi:transposase InsO family protein